MIARASGIDLADGLREWVEAACGLPVASAARHFAGASREAWTLEVGPDARPLFLLKDKGAGQGSARDAAVLRALADSPVPVPRLIGYDESRAAILLERVRGRSDFPAVDHASEREPTARHLMELTGRLHRLEIDTLEIPHLERPASPEACARVSLDTARSALDTLGPEADPFFRFALDWLEANTPGEIDRYSLVHSDMGPGNFLYEAGRVTGIVDWEVAHFGDPMEDLAAIAVRDMATPIGHLPTRLREYEASSGIRVDLGRVHYYRALVLVRNSLMIGLGLAQPPEGFDVVEMTMYQTLLARAASLVLCDNLGVPRPLAASALPTSGDSSGLRGARRERALLIAALERDLEQEIAPVVSGTLAERVQGRMARGLATLAHEARVGDRLDARERVELAELLGREHDAASQGLEALESRLREVLPEIGRDPDRRTRVAGYFARRLQRLAERRRPLMGPLYDRLPQPLEDAGSAPARAPDPERAAGRAARDEAAGLERRERA